MKNYFINFADAANVMPQRINAETKAMKISKLNVSAKLALDASDDGNGICLTIRLEDELGKYTIVNYDPRQVRVHYQHKLYISKDIVDEAVAFCLQKLEERFPTCRQLTIDDMLQ